MVKNCLKVILWMIATTALIKTANAQLQISGQTCVSPGIIYQYVISGSFDSLSSKLCVTAGMILDSLTGSIQCKTSGFSSKAILIVWNDSTSDEGSISLTSPAGNVSLNVHFAAELQPGSIDSTSKTQFITTNQIPAPILCGSDSGGACSPTYYCQWQQSSDMVSWSDVPSANAQSLSFTMAMSQTTYYRRKVVERNSGTIGYSDVATVFVTNQ